MMTVEDLISTLQKFDKNLTVTFQEPFYCTIRDINNVTEELNRSTETYEVVLWND